MLNQFLTRKLVKVRSQQLFSGHDIIPYPSNHFVRICGYNCLAIKFQLDREIILDFLRITLTEAPLEIEDDILTAAVGHQEVNPCAKLPDAVNLQRLLILSWERNLTTDRCQTESFHDGNQRQHALPKMTTEIVQ